MPIYRMAAGRRSKRGSCSRRLWGQLRHLQRLRAVRAAAVAAGSESTWTPRIPVRQARLERRVRIQELVARVNRVRRAHRALAVRPARCSSIRPTTRPHRVQQDTAQTGSSAVDGRSTSILTTCSTAGFETPVDADVFRVCDLLDEAVYTCTRWIREAPIRACGKDTF